jgi:dUTP pyrophosphatase
MEDKEYFEDDRKDFITYAKEAIGQAPLEVKFKKLDERAVIPSYAHDGDVGMDLTAISCEYDADNDMYVYHTGLAFESDYHYGIFLFPRSSNRKTEAYLCNHVGIADSAIYRGEIILCFKNRTSLRQIALESRVVEFSNAISNGIRTESAKSIGMQAWNNAFKNPMIFAPYKVGDRVAQMVVLPYPNVKLREVNNLSETDRGSGGFGSTGN